MSVLWVCPWYFLLFVDLTFSFNWEMLKYFCKCPHDAAITINFILLFFNWISNLLLILKYFLRVLLKKLFWVINLLILLRKWIRRALALSICKIQFSSVAQSCPTLCDHTDYSIQGLPVHHQLPEFTPVKKKRVLLMWKWTHVHWVNDAKGLFRWWSLVSMHLKTRGNVAFPLSVCLT